jgi:hypothetical protein
MPEVPEVAVKRTNRRFSFVAEAELTTLRGGAGLRARVSELSSRGCYVDTPEAFPVDTDLRLRIRYGGSTCELPGKVIYTHRGWGMGVRFGEMEPAQRFSLNFWLAELARKSRSANLRAAPSPVD